MAEEMLISAEESVMANLLQIIVSCTYRWEGKHGGGNMAEEMLISADLLQITVSCTQVGG